MSTFFNEVCAVLGVKHVNTTAYHTQANGAAERFHRTINRALGLYVNAAGNDWDTLLPLFLMSYRAAPSTVTGYSPFYLLHGREMVVPNTHNLRAKL
jgi:transposase InsO family protein